jgi:hypothetical protein
MSTETDNIATVVDGEALISLESVESFSTVKDKIKGVPETDEENVIGSSRTTATGGKKKAAIGSVENGAIGTTKIDVNKKTNQESEPGIKADMVAVFSTRNVLWQGVGSISKGYNIFSKSVADQWLTRGHVRLATPQEVAEEYGL